MIRQTVDLILTLVAFGIAIQVVIFGIQSLIL